MILVGVVSGILAARGLGVAGRGQLAAVILWPAVLTTLAEAGLPTAFVYLSASGGRAPRQLAGSILPLLGLQCLVLYAAGIPIVLVALSSYPSSVRTSAAWFLVVYAPTWLAVRYLLALNQGTGRIGVLNVVRLLVPTLYAAVLAVLLIVGVVGVSAFAAAYVASWIVALCALMFISSDEVRRGALAPKADLATKRRAWAVGYRTYFGTLAPLDTLQLDVLLTTSFLGATAAGLYYVAASAGLTIRMWGTTLGALSLPRVAAAATREEALKWAARFTRVTAFCSGVVALVAFLFARPLLTLIYGPEFAPASLLVRILAVGMLAASLRYVLGDGLRGLGRHTTATRAEVIGLVLGGATLAVSLPLWGVTGVAIAVSVSYFGTLATMVHSYRELGAGLPRLLVPTRSDLSGLRSMIADAWDAGGRHSGEQQ